MSWKGDAVLDGGVLLRPARHEDCEGVMAIHRNVYDGIDYLQWTFHNHVTDPNRYPVVAVLDGNIVGYHCAGLIDDKKSVVGEAARVSPQQQGKRIFEKMQNWIISTARKAYPQVERAMWTSANEKASRTSVAKSIFTNIYQMRSRVSCDANVEELKRTCESATFQELSKELNVSGIRAVPQREAIHLLTHHIDFPSMNTDKLCVNFEPWGLYRSTFVKLMSHSRLHVTECSKSGKVMAMSFGTVMNITLGVRYRCDFYCSQEVADRQRLMAAHLLYQIREIAECQLDFPVSFSFLFPRDWPKEGLSGVLQKLGLKATKTPESTGFILGYEFKDVPEAKL